MRHRPLIVCACLLAAACGSWDRDSNGGGSNLPNRGVIPWQVDMEPIPERDAGTDAAPDEAGDAGDVEAADVPTERVAYLLENDELRFLNPAIVDVDDVLTLFVEVRERDANRIAWATSSDGGATFTELQPALVAADLPEAWEADDRIGAPSASFDGATWHLAFAYGREDGIGYASGPSPDQLQIRSEPLLVPGDEVDVRGASDPSLVPTDTGWRLYYIGEGEIPGEDDDVVRTGPNVVLAQAGPDLAFERVGIVWSQNLACPPVDEGSGEGAGGDCWESAGITAPEVRVGSTLAGRTVWRMFYSAGDDAKAGVGFAASFDGLSWSGFDYNPVIDEDIYDEYGAATAFLGDRYVIFYNRDRTFERAGVVRAVNDRPVPSERF